jgi:hypothetical protein
MYGLSNPILRLLITGALGVFGAMGIVSCGTNPKPTEPDASATADPTGIEDEGLSLGAGQHPGHRGFYPLAIGNTWEYEVQEMTVVRPDSCGSPCVMIGTIGQWRERRELVGTEVLFGREYVVEEQIRWSDWGIPFDTLSIDTTAFPTASPMTYRVRYRQDRAGLYEADVPVGQPLGTNGGLAVAYGAPAPGANERLSVALQRRGMLLTATEAAAYDAADARLQEKWDLVASALAWHRHRPGPPGGHRGGVLDHEITRLRYPLHPGQRWTIREDPLFTSCVIRHELLRLPAGRLGGYRIRIESELFGPEDRVYIWYGRAGFLKLSATLYGEATDPYGNHLGTVVSTEFTTLESFTLVGD